MCLPGNTIAGTAFRSGVSGRIRDTVFGRGTSQKITDLVDKGAKKTIAYKGKRAILGDVSQYGVAPGSIPGPNKRGNIDFAAEKKRDKARRAAADKKNFMSLNHGRPTILGG